MDRLTFIDDYVRAVDARLARLPRRWRRQVLAELRTGLETAALRHERQGRSRTEAEYIATVAWGPVDQLVRDVGHEALTFGVRRVSYLVMVSLPLLSALWAALLRADPVTWWTEPSPPVEAAGQAMGVLCVVTLGASVCTLVSARSVQGIWWRRSAVLRFRLSLIAGCGLLAVVAAGLAMFLTCGVTEPELLVHPWSSAPVAASVYLVVAIGVELRGLLRSIRVACP